MQFSLIDLNHVSFFISFLGQRYISSDLLPSMPFPFFWTCITLYILLSVADAVCQLFLYHSVFLFHKPHRLETDAPKLENGFPFIYRPTLLSGFQLFLVGHVFCIPLLTTWHLDQKQLFLTQKCCPVEQFCKYRKDTCLEILRWKKNQECEHLPFSRIFQRFLCC